MLDWNELNRKLTTASNTHHKLFEKFKSFANHIEKQITDKTPLGIKGITVLLNIEEGYFITYFAGRFVRFYFLSELSPDNESLVGYIMVMLIRDLPEQHFIPLGSVVFDHNGETTLLNPNDSDLMNIDNDSDALYVVLNFINNSLSE